MVVMKEELSEHHKDNSQDGQKSRSSEKKGGRGGGGGGGGAPSSAPLAILLASKQIEMPRMTPEWTSGSNHHDVEEIFRWELASAQKGRRYRCDKHDRAIRSWRMTKKNNTARAAVSGHETCKLSPVSFDRTVERKTPAMAARWKQLKSIGRRTLPAQTAAPPRKPKECSHIKPGSGSGKQWWVDKAIQLLATVLL